MHALKYGFSKFC